jgi:F-type H+-transporting ATPase subunit c
MLNSTLLAVQEVAGVAQNDLGLLGASLAVGLTVIGAAIGIGMIGSSAVQGMARQPEAAGNIQTSAIILSAFIEGAALFGLVITLLYKLL